MPLADAPIIPGSWGYAGHSEATTTDLYVRRGRKARGSCVLPFPELVEQTFTQSFNALPLSDEPPQERLQSGVPNGTHSVVNIAEVPEIARVRVEVDLVA